MKKILVTGAAGFIGSQLVDALIEQGNTVVGVDIFDASYDPAIKFANLSRVQANARFKLYQVDVRDEPAIYQIVSKSNPLVVIHLAAQVGAQLGLMEAEEMWNVNVNGTQSVVAACSRAGIGVVMASSASVYGSGAAWGCREDSLLPQSANRYAGSKQAAERVALEEARRQGTGVVVLRLASTYGPRQRPGTGLDTFAARLIRRESVPVFKDVATRRDIVFVADVVRALVMAVDRTGASEIVNIGSGRSVTMKEVVEALAGALGMPASLAYVPAPPWYKDIGVIDIERAKKTWNFEPQVPLQEGLAKYAQWYLANATGGIR